MGCPTFYIRASGVSAVCDVCVRGMGCQICYVCGRGGVAHPAMSRLEGQGAGRGAYLLCLD